MIIIMKVGINNQGFVYPIRIIILSNISEICKQSIRATGKRSSTAPISLEKRLSMRPDELVLKNLIVARLMELNILSCNLLEAPIHAMKNEYDLTKVNTIVQIINPVYI